LSIKDWKSGTQLYNLVESERFQLTRLGAAKLTRFPFRREPDCLLEKKKMIPQKKSFKKQKKYENLKVEGFFTSLNLEGFSGVFSFYKYLQLVAAVVVVGFQWRRFLTINQWNFHLKTDKHIRGMKNRIENEKNPDESLSVSLYLPRNSSYFVSECLRGKREGERERV
jgi:hypothetical protein